MLPNNDVIGCFAHDHTEARTNFLSAFESVKAGVISYRHPSKGPGGEALFADAAYLGEQDPKEIIVICSGVHGVEGFCGSACQTAWIKENKKKYLDSSKSLFFIHGLNPYGLAWLRRTNEENVDVNRNFVMHGRTYPTNPGYDALAPHLLPSTWDSPVKEAADRELQAYRDAHGEAAYRKALLLGQYDHAEGLFYGGRRPTWSTSLFSSLLLGLPKSVQSVTFVDLHTGIGEYGQMTVHYSFDEIAMGRVRDKFQIDTVPLEEIEQNPDVYYDATGTTLNAAVQLMHGQTVTAIRVEFGTVPFDDMVDAVRADAWLNAHGTLDSDEGRRIKRQVREAFCPEDGDWKLAVYKQARTILNKAVFGH